MSLACQENKSWLSAWAWFEKWHGGAARFEIANRRAPGHYREEHLDDFLRVSGWYDEGLHFYQEIDQVCPRTVGELGEDASLPSSACIAFRDWRAWAKLLLILE